MTRSIKSIIREVIVSHLDEWLDNITDFGKVLGTPVWVDDESGDMFYLFVGFTSYGDLESFSYSFMLLDRDNKPKTEYLTKRNEVKNYLPSEMVGYKKIFPIVEDLTRKLLNNMLPEEIYRKTVEPLTGDSLERYRRITDIMTNEYGYVIKETYTDKDGCTVWVLNKDIDKNNNKDMLETYEVGGIPDKKQILKDTFDHILPLIPKRY